MVVPAWVTAFFRYFNQLLGIVTGIQAAQAAQATAAQQSLILANTNTIITAINDATNGLTAIKNAINDLSTLVGTNDTAILTAIGAIPVTGVPVTLPATFPPTWATGTGDAVWGWPVPTSTNPAFTFLTLAGWAAQQRGFPQVQEYTPFATALWTLVGTWGEDGVSDPNPNSTFDLDVTTILASDATSADWLNRVYSTVTWLPPFPNGCLGIDDVDGSNWSWVVDLPTDKWLELKANLGLTASVIAAPIWPGLSRVTLGTPVTISSQFTITGPMDGVLVDITALAANKPFFDFDGNLSYRNIGALTFTSDDGQQEFPQNLGFTTAVYCPKTMVQAASCSVRADLSMTGTVTPWVIT